MPGFNPAALAYSAENANDVVVLISEYKAIARLGNSYLISNEGKVFNGIATESLPVFNTAVENVSEALSDYKLIEQVLANRNVTADSININGFGITKLYLSNGLNVVICGSDIEDSLRILDNYWDTLYVTNPGLDYVNMCYKNAMAINAIRKPAKISVESVEVVKGRYGKPFNGSLIRSRRFILRNKYQY